ncbi:MAG: ThiF family adenylyltransferase [Burkholderiaceae bacterium]
MSNDRYLRHTQIDGLSQDALGASSVLVLGAGAIGNEVVKNLALLGCGRITIVDRDRVERHNLTRSVLLREADIGRDKASAVAERASALDPAVGVEPVVGDLFRCLGPDTVRAHDVVIGALDNFEARIRANQLCLLSAVPYVDAAIDARAASVSVFPFAAGRPVACYECGLPASVHRRLAERMGCGGLLRAALAERIMPTTTLTSSIAAAFAVGEALKLAGCDQRVSAPTQAGRIFIDSLTGNAQRSGLAPADLCPGCGLLPSPARWLGRAGSIDGALALFDDPRGRRTYRFSDPLVWGCACTRCAREPAGGRFVGRRAAALSEAITRCAHCATTSVLVEVRDQADGAALRERFADRLPESVWLLDDDRLVGLDGSHGPVRADEPSCTDSNAHPRRSA